MKRNSSLFCALCARAFVVVLLCGVTASWGQSFSNPSFEGQGFTVFPGYISVNTAVNGWTASRPERAGLNPAAGSPFADNGVIPNGTNVAFLQSAQGGAPSVLSTTVNGLTPGQNYQVNFRMNARTGAGAAAYPTINIGVQTNPIVTFAISNVAGANPYRFGAFDFVASAASQTIYFTNNTAADATLLLDDFSIVATNRSWTIAVFTNDATIDIDSSRVYTHAYNFGGSAAPNVTINGVNFTGVVGANPAVNGSFRVEGIPNAFTTDDGNLVTGNSSTLMKRFVYGGNPGKLAITGLTPGVEYVATLYTVGWENGFRSQTLAHGNNRVSFNEDAFGDGYGMRISYRYVAPITGTIVIDVTPMFVPNTLHLFGFSNYQITSPGSPVFMANPKNQITSSGSNVTFQAVAAGASPISYLWLTNGVVVDGETNRTFSRLNVSSADILSYQAVASNAFGMTTSAVATISFGQISNPSFESEVFLNYPGYASGNTNISGWTLSTPTRSGLNPLLNSESPFANNGVVPDGTQVAFLQSTSAISTVLHDLVPNTTYAVQFRVNARGGQTPVLHTAIDGQTVIDTRLNNVTGTNAYRLVSFNFVASNTTAVLSLTNDQAGDMTALIDNFSISASTSKWSTAAWTNDASAGVDPSKLYTHAFHFGTTVPDTVINGITFKGIAGANPSAAGQFVSAGFPTAYNLSDSNIFDLVGGGSAGMSKQFIYGGAQQSITLTNLYPGVAYVFTLYSIAFDATKGYGRSATFSVNGDRATLNQDQYGADAGIRFAYPYVADASGSIRFVFEATDSASTIHTYGFANYAAVDTVPVIAFQPQSAFIPAGELATLSVALSAGSQPTYYQWQENGVDLVDQTNASLFVSKLNAGDLASYRVIISNYLGSVTSEVATVEWGTKLSEVFNTGVDNIGALIGDAAVDPHYQLVSSSDATAPGPRAFTLINGVYPVQPGTYSTNGPFSRWIGPTTNTAVGNVPGIYVYRTSFVIDTTDPSRSQISGGWSSDNDGLDILLNGVSLGISNRAARPFEQFFKFTITNGFVAGSNTLDFVISNAPPTGPTGFRAELKGVGRPLPPTAPQIVSDVPASLLVQEGANATLAVVASGSATLAYQWFFGDVGSDLDVAGETNRVLIITNVTQFEHEGVMYNVRVTNSQGTDFSSAVTLTVNAQPTANPDHIACGTNQPVTFPASKLLFNDGDADGDALSFISVSATSANGGTLSNNAGTITYTPNPIFAGNDTFTYTIGDARGGRGTGMVTVTVGATNFLSITQPAALLPNGHFVVGYSGVANYPYTIERATNVLGPWQVFTNIAADANGFFTLDDPSTTNAPMQFYRTRYP